MKVSRGGINEEERVERMENRNEDEWPSDGDWEADDEYRPVVNDPLAKRVAFRWLGRHRDL